MRRSTLLLAALAVAVLVAGSALAAPPSTDNWPSFRGADAMSVADDDPRLPESWSTTENVVWVADVPGLGWSSPIVQGERVFVTSVWSDGEVEEPKKGLYLGGNRMQPSSNVHHWTVYCFDVRTGEKCWEREVLSGAPDFPRHLKNTYASETPVTDGERLYAYFGNVGVFAFTLDGEPIWELRVRQPDVEEDAVDGADDAVFEVAPTRYGWGTAASPIVHNGQLYIVNDNEDQSWMVALDAATGEELWRDPRDEGSNWATPFVWENELRTEVITVGTDQVRSYDKEGKLLWHFGGMSSIAIPQPFSEYGLLYVSSGYIGDQVRPVYAIKPGAEGDITLEEGQQSNQWVVWYQPQAGSYNPTPLIYRDRFYTLLDRGFFSAHDPKTGAVVYSKTRIERGSGAFTASPWAYNGKIFVLSEDGDTFVIEAGDEFKVVGKNSLDEMCMSTPAIAAGSLFIRTRSKLYRLTNQGASAGP